MCICVWDAGVNPSSSSFGVPIAISIHAFDPEIVRSLLPSLPVKAPPIKAPPIKAPPVKAVPPPWRRREGSIVARSTNVADGNGNVVGGIVIVEGVGNVDEGTLESAVNAKGIANVVDDMATAQPAPPAPPPHSSRDVAIVRPVPDDDDELKHNVLQRIRYRGSLRSFYVVDGFLYALLSSEQQALRVHGRLDKKTVCRGRATLNCGLCCQTDCQEFHLEGSVVPSASERAASQLHQQQHRAGKKSKAGVRQKSKSRHQFYYCM